LIYGVLFDLDGTLLDSIMSMQKAFVKVVEGLGANITEEERHNVGENLSKILTTRSSPFASISFLWRLGKYVGLPTHKRIHMMILTYNRLKYIANNSNLFNSVPEVLEVLRNRGVKMAIVTTRSRNELIHILKMFSIESYFSAAVSRDDVKNGKPSPDPLLFALKQLGLKPNETAMVGDMPTDIEAGRRAGTKTVGLLNGIFKKELIASHPDVSINSILEVPAVLNSL
jgi:HAD superfamily hydrolase (TIGR01509 family)